MDLSQPGYWEMLIGRSVARLFLFAALSDRPMHGYELARTIAESCGGCCEPTDAMIYPTIHELAENEYLECTVETQGGRERKVCHLTPKGRDAFRAAADAWERVLPHIEGAVAAARETRSEANEQGTTTAEVSG